MKRLLFVLAACGGSAPPVVAPVTKPPATAPRPVDVAWDQLSGPVKDVSVTAADATLVPKVKELLAGQIGKDLDRTQLREATSQVFALPGVGDVLVRGTQRADGITLDVEITAQPTVHAITASPGVTLPGQVAAANGRPLDPVLLDQITRELREQYLAKGYVDATARWTTKPAGTQVDVSIEVVPGVATVIQQVDFSGNAHVKTADLEKTIAADMAPGSPWSDLHVERAQQQVMALYYDRGYINVAVTPPQPSSVATFDIKEGDQFRVGKLSIKDASPADQKKWLARLGVKKGDVFSRSAMTTGMQKLKDATAASDITPITNIDTAKKTIDISFELQKSVSPSSK